MLDTKVKVFHESNSCFMKWPWNCISWNALKEKFHSVSFPLEISQNSQENTCTRVSFLIRSQAFRLQIPKNFSKLFKSTYFEELLQTIASAPLFNEYSRMKECVSKINEMSQGKSWKAGLNLDFGPSWSTFLDLEPLHM